MLTTNAVAAKSCLECRRRKIRCDKCVPCSYCVKVKIKCRYPTPKSASEKGESWTLGNEIQSARIDSIENTLQTLERRISQISETLQQTHATSNSGQCDTHGLEARHLRDQIPPARTISSGSIGLGSRRPSTSYNFEDDLGNVCPRLSRTQSPFTVSPTGSLDSLHPPPSTIFFMWQTYLERVDPVLKLIHTQTVQQDIMNFMRRKSRLDLARHISMFAIYYTSVITMSGKECWEELHESKGTALKGFRDELESSLEQSGFLNTSDLTVIQSFVLYIVCGRFDKRGPDTNRLKDVAIRLAFQNNLHRDGLEFDMAPFEVEIRRRLWWQICVLDVRTAEDNGSDPQILTTSFTTRFPSNVNDANLHPDMSEMPQSYSGRTEMSFTLVRFEGSNFARRVVFSDKFCQENSYDILSGPEKHVAINNFRDQIEENYLSHLDKSVPLDFITAASIRLILVKLKLAVNKPQTRQSQHLVMQQSFRKTCVEILQRARLLRHYEKGNKWLWLFQTYLEWPALSYLFINLSLVPSGDDVDLAWGAVDDIYDYWKNHSETCLNYRWKDIEDLRSRALYARGLVQREPSVFAMSPMGSCDPNPFDMNTQVQSRPISQAEAVSTGLQDEGITESQNIPSAGTGCQWSAEIFEKYFEVLDSEHILHRSWL